MLYAVLCYNSKEAASSSSQEDDDAVMAKLDVVHRKLAKAGKFGPAVRLLPPLATDNPFAESSERLLDFYVVDFASLDEAIEATRDLAKANPGGAYEIRPIRLFLPGSLPE